MDISPISNTISNISIEDLLARHPKDLDLKAVEEFIKGKNVLITGAGGSIGSELSLQVERFGANEIYLVEHSEYNLYQINEKLQKSNHRNYLVDIKNRDRLEEIFQSHKIDLVLHAAAYKHVPLCEENIDSAVENNILGSINVIELSISNDRKKKNLYIIYCLSNLFRDKINLIITHRRSTWQTESIAK